MNESLEISVLENASASLVETIEELADSTWFNQQKLIIQDTLIAGAIQKFEFVYELSLKMIKRQLKVIAIADDFVETESFMDILRQALKYGLIDDMNSWIAYRQMRNITSHTYDQNKAMLVYEQISDFLLSSQFLLEQLRKRNKSECK